MKELIGSTANVYAVSLGMGTGEFAPMVEVILLLTEPRYEPDAAGTFSRRRDVEDVRFHTTPNGLRELAGNFAKLADDAEMEVLGRLPDPGEVREPREE